MNMFKTLKLPALKCQRKTREVLSDAFCGRRLYDIRVKKLLKDTLAGHSCETRPTTLLSTIFV